MFAIDALPLETSYVGQGIITVMLGWFMWRYEKKTEDMKAEFVKRADNVARIWEDHAAVMRSALNVQTVEINRLREALLFEPTVTKEQRDAILRGPAGPGPMFAKE